MQVRKKLGWAKHIRFFILWWTTPVTLIIMSHDIYNLHSQTRSHEKCHSNLCSRSTGWRNWSSRGVRRLGHVYKTRSSHQRPTAKRGEQKFLKGQNLLDYTAVHLSAYSPANAPVPPEPTWENFKCECQSETEGSLKAGNMLTDLHGTLPQPDHLKKHDIFHAVFLVVTVHASSSFTHPFPLFSRALLSFLRLKQRNITGQQ